MTSSLLYCALITHVLCSVVNRRGHRVAMCCWSCFVRCFFGGRDLPTSLRCVRCLLITLNLVHMLLSSLLLSVFTYAKELMWDRQQAQLVDEVQAELGSMNGVVIMGIIVGAVAMFNSWLGACGACCRSSTVVMEAHAVMACIEMLLELTTTVEILNLNLDMKDHFKKPGVLSFCPMCSKFLMGPAGALEIAMWVFVVNIVLQVFLLGLAVQWTIKVKRLHRRQTITVHRGQSFLADSDRGSPHSTSIEMPVQMRTRSGIYKKFSSNSTYSKVEISPLRNERAGSSKAVTFATTWTLMEEEQPLDLTTSDRL